MAFWGDSCIYCEFYHCFFVTVKSCIINLYILKLLRNMFVIPVHSHYLIMTGIFFVGCVARTNQHCFVFQFCNGAYNAPYITILFSIIAYNITIILMFVAWILLILADESTNQFVFFKSSFVCLHTETTNTLLADQAKMYKSIL